MARLDLHAITKSFGSTRVLEGIDLAVADGEFMTLMGPSGCGKSTLIRIIAGLEPQDSGSVAIGDRTVDDLRAHERRVAMVFQSYALYPHMSVGSNIGLPLTMSRLALWERLPLLRLLSARRRQVMRGIAQDVGAIASQLQIQHLLDRKPGQLSGGQRQRVALGRAMVRQPEMFLMDEPLSNLDAKLRVHMRTELAELHKRLGATFIYVTHDQVEAMTMSDRVAMMDMGRILQLGTPSELYHTPADVKVATFVGSPTINLLPARVSPSGAIELAGQDIPVAVALRPGMAVTLGLRPENIRVVDADAPSGAPLIRTRLRRRENLGPEYILHCDTGGTPSQTLLVRMPASAVLPPDDALDLTFDVAACHVFDEDGRRAPTPRRGGRARTDARLAQCPPGHGLIMQAVATHDGFPPANTRRMRLERILGLGFVAPAFILILLTNVLPLGALSWLSLTNYEFGALSSDFVGLGNFQKAFADPIIRRSLANTFLYVAILLPGAVFLGLLVAVLVHGRRRTRSFYEVIYFLPVTSTLIAMATVWQFVLHPNLGPVNAVLKAVGIGEIAFLSEPAWALPTLAVIGIWQLIGFNMILFLAGLSAIPRDLYEAAEVDGCTTGIDRFLTITWPLLGPTTMFVIVTTSISAFKVFDTVAVMTRGGPMGSSEVLLYNIYLEGFQYFHTGYAAALNFIFLAFILVFSMIQTFVLDRRTHY